MSQRPLSADTLIWAVFVGTLAAHVVYFHAVKSVVERALSKEFTIHYRGPRYPESEYRDDSADE